MDDDMGRRAARTAGALLIAATVATGLMAGTFYAFACAVMPALGRAGDRVFVDVMRDVDEVIENAVFLPVFLGALALVGLSGWQVRGAAGRWWVWAGGAAYALAFLVTVAVSVPPNDALARPGDPAVLRERFEGAWVAWNAVRAGLATVATGCLARGLMGARRG